MGGVELSCGNGPGLGLWQLWPAGSGHMPAVAFLELFLFAFLWPWLLGGGLGNVGAELGSWRGCCERRENALCLDPQLGFTEKAHFVHYLLSYLGMSKVHSLYV